MNEYRDVQKAIDYINQWILGLNEDNDLIQKNEVLKIDDVCNQVHISPKIFQNTFFAIMGKTIKQYIDDCRFSLIAEELRTTTKTIQITALKYGYESDAVLNKAFKKKFGYTPGEFRKSNRFIAPYKRIELEKKESNSNFVMNEKHIFELNANEDVNWGMRYLLYELGIYYEESEYYISWAKILSLNSFNLGKFYHFLNSQLYNSCELFCTIYDLASRIDDIDSKWYPLKYDEWLTPISLVIYEFYTDYYEDIVNEMKELYKIGGELGLEKLFIKAIKNLNISPEKY